MRAVRHAAADSDRRRTGELNLNRASIPVDFPDRKKPAEPALLKRNILITVIHESDRISQDQGILKLILLIFI